jgi:hypothetical protein
MHICTDIVVILIILKSNIPSNKDFPINQKMRHAKQIKIHVDAMKSTYMELESLQAEMAVTRKSRLTIYACLCIRMYVHVCSCMIDLIKIFTFSSCFRMHAGRMHRRTSWGYVLPVPSQMLPWTTSSSEHGTLVQLYLYFKWEEDTQLHPIYYLPIIFAI